MWGEEIEPLSKMIIPGLVPLLTSDLFHLPSLHTVLLSFTTQQPCYKLSARINENHTTVLNNPQMTQTPTLLFVALSVLPLASSLFFPELLLSTSLLNPNPTFIPQPSLPSLTLSSSYATFTPAQTTFASAWRILDNTFTDRTFNGQDWFATRQKYLKTGNIYPPSKITAQILNKNKT